MNDEAPQVSIIVPIYNADKYLSACLDSLLSQSFNSIEILCIDDGSTDLSSEILREYTKRDGRVKVFTQKNSGPARARNVGLENARGEYIMFCDSDDTYRPNMCEVMVTTIQKECVDLVMCNTLGYDRSGEEQYNGYYFPFTQGKYQISNQIKQKINVFLWNKIFKKSLIDLFHITFPDGHKADDNLFIYQYVSVAKTCYFVNKKCYNHFDRENSIMDLYRSEKIRIEDVYDKVDIFLYFFEFLKKNNIISENRSCLSELFYEELFYAWIHVSDRWIEAFLERASSTIHMISLDQFEYDDIEKGIIIQKLNDRKFYEVAKLLDFKIGQRSRERRQYVGCSYPEPAFNTNIVPIVFNCDDKFVKYLSVTLQSIIANASSNYNYDIIILNTDINEKKQSVLTRFYKQHPNVSIRFYNMERISQEFGIENYTTSNNHVTTVAYYRLFIETVFKNYNKIIYLDSDIIVKDDISRFINVDLDNFACAAVRDSLISRLSDRDEYKFKGFCEYSETVLGLDNLTNYFNSGVMLFNVKRLIENNYQEKLIDVARKNNKYFNDQNVLNSVLQHDVKIIETTWNAQLNSGFFGGLVDVQPFEDLHILHYCSQIKPWKDSSVEFADVWWGYARQTPFYEVLIAELCEAEDNVNKLLVTDHMVQVLKNGFFKKVKKYKDGKKMTRYFGGIFKKIKSIQSKKYYLLGVQVWHKKR